NLHLAAVLEKEGFRSADLPPTHNFDTETLMSDWSHKHIAYIADASVVQGYPDGTYKPNAVVGRDQMAVYVGRAFELPT
ncbi:MAG: S-layer homology domain-containing protein, partial [Armatimonadetes bacterium]|nr:S-layer homology domain-containing protein [Armatimonadota bacterium]